MSKPKPSDIDISLSASGPNLGWRGNAVLWCAVFVIVMVMFYVEPPLWWMFTVCTALALAAFVGWVLWILIVKRGVFTWMRLALAPARFMARGEAAAAELACQKALARARRFAANDSRRGLMLCELAMFVKHQGRYPQALALFEEAVDILGQHAGTQPIGYFVALNNYSIYFIHRRDYAGAQRILERAIDLTLTVKKRQEGIIAAAPVDQVQGVQFVLHLNLAFLLIEMGELTEADAQLRDADTLLPLLSRAFRRLYGDHHVAMNALWAYEAGHFADAEEEAAKAQNRDYFGLLRVRANLQRLRGEFAEAERLLRLHQAEERKKGPLHRPEMLKPTLDLAECQFGQANHEAAFAGVAEACALVADFALPMDAYWRRAVQTWLERATTHGKAELVETLATELQRAPAPVNQAITILDKIRAGSKAPG